MINDKQIKEAYLKVLSENKDIPYTQGGFDFITAEMTKILGSSAFKAVPIEATSKEYRESRNIQFIVGDVK